ncbi:MAG TPA: group III truncated hemoglobin [Polyangiaceae bacterium]|nr:group III truncated hemoglobin [Polyangiaceae bacterium]
MTSLPPDPDARTRLSSLADCRSLVDAFYARVREDPLLGPVFASRIEDGCWPAHLERMASFWYTVLFGAPLYHGNPRAKHRDLPIAWEHFEHWLGLWSSTVDELFVGERAEEAKARARRMALVLSSATRD